MSTMDHGLSWPWAAVDPGRVQRAKKVSVLRVDPASASGEFAGSSGEVYAASLVSCSCRDFALQHGAQPCKHMVRLAMELHVINDAGLTPTQQREADLKADTDALARAYGYYYLLGRPVLSDAEYDRLKSRVLPDK